MPHPSAQMALRTWFLAVDAPLGHHMAALAAPALGRTLVVQRDAPVAVTEGLVLSGLDAGFLRPTVDPKHGVAHVVRAVDLAQALAVQDQVAAVHVVSPSRCGAVADIPALAGAAHSAGVPLMVDETWREPLRGVLPDLPPGALAQGADLVVSGRVPFREGTPGAVLRLGHGPQAQRLESSVDKAFDFVRSMSGSGDPERAGTVLPSARHRVQAAIDSAERIRDAIRAQGRFALVGDGFGRFPEIAGADPLRIAVDTGAGGICAYDARSRLADGHRIRVEAVTGSVIVASIAPGSVSCTESFIDAVHALPSPRPAAHAALQVSPPTPGPSQLTVRQAYFARSRAVAAAEAVGRLSASAVTACPPGVPIVLPGEVITAQTVAFLALVAASPSGRVLGAAAADATSLRVVDE
ncbi:Orn/Lys/Arg family decarboxylase [Streptomyces sp. NPDC001999]